MLFNKVNQYLENSRVYVPTILSFYIETLVIGHKVGKDSTAISATDHLHMLSFQHTFSVALLLKCH